MDKMQDHKLQSLLKQEKLRQKQGINLIASENYTSQEVMDIAGSIFCNKSQLIKIY